MRGQLAAAPDSRRHVSGVSVGSAAVDSSAGDKQNETYVERLVDSKLSVVSGAREKMAVTDVPVGARVEDLPTPSLLVEAEALERNLRRMADYFAQRPCKLRPHFKSHKCVRLAREQLSAGGAVGITCAKLAEAEYLVKGGVAHVLIANQVVGRDKVRRLAALQRDACVRVCVDCERHVDELAQAAREAGVEIGCLVEVDVGMGRCGVQPGEAALTLARLLDRASGVRFDGLQGYEGHAVMIADAEERRRAAREAMGRLVEARELIERAGLMVSIVSGGGTGTYDVTGNFPGVTELQAGSYALMDAHYRTIRPEFDCALTVLATVISRPSSNRAVLDVGVKGIGAQFGPPVLADYPGATIERFRSEEHTVVTGLALGVGRKVRLIPSHVCTTCNLHRRLLVVAGGRVADVWPIEAAGALE